MIRYFIAALLGVVYAGAVAAEQPRALARVEGDASSLIDTRNGAELVLSLSQPVPYRVYTRTGPDRVVMEFQEVLFDVDIDQLDQSERVTDVETGSTRDGWSQLVLLLATPMQVSEAGLETGVQAGQATVRLRMAVVSPETFAARAQPGALAGTQATEDAASQDGRLIVALDPGHGGVDPGAQRDGYDEADLMLLFAKELREALLRDGIDEVILTRRDDSFVSLPARISAARAGQADLLISLHADAISEGRATGTRIYTLSQEASDRASALLAERQDRQDILAGIDLRAQDDEIATILMSLARQQTAPSAERLADQLVSSMRLRLGKMHKRPRLRAGFSVLKAPDIPSVLVELGFMSSQSDLENLLDPVWRGQAAEGIVDAIRDWATEEEARRQ